MVASRLINVPLWSRPEFLAVVDATDALYRMRFRRGEIPWPVGGVGGEFPYDGPTTRRRRYTPLHALAWRASEALGLSNAKSAEVIRSSIGGILRQERALLRENPYTGLLFHHATICERRTGEIVNYLSGPHGIIWNEEQSPIEAMDEIRRTDSGFYPSSRYYHKATIWIDLAAEFEVVLARAKDLNLFGDE